MFVKIEDILSATNGGLDIILMYYPQARECVNSRKKQFKIRDDERTPSAALKQLSDGTWIVTDFGDDHVSRNGINICMHEDHLSFKEAIAKIASLFNVGGLTSEFNKPEFKKRKARDDEKPRSYSFEYRDITESDLKILGDRITIDIAKKYGVKSLVSFTYIDAEGEATTTLSNDNYPIFLFEFGEFRKIYQPNCYDKNYRFRYDGNKPKDHIFGLAHLIQAYNDFNSSNEEGITKRLRECLIAGGERDALNIAGMGYPVVWFNSETAVITDKQFNTLRKYAENIYYVGDIDKTGIKSAFRHGLANLDLNLVFLPEKLMEYTDKRRNKRKDTSDFVEIYSNEYFNKIVAASCPLRFYDICVTDKGTTFQFNNKQVYLFLQANGFCRIDNPNSRTGSSIVRIQENIVTEQKPEHVKEFIIKYCRDNYMPIGIENMIHRTKQLSEQSLVSLPVVDIDFTNCDRGTQYMFFKHVTWKITSNQVIEIKSKSTDKYVWDKEVLDHDVKILKPFFKISGSIDTGFNIEIENNHGSNFFNYLVNTSRVHWRKEFDGIEDIEAYRKSNNFKITSDRLDEIQNSEQIHHLVNKIFGIGYLLHRFKEKSRAWLVFAMDNKLSDIGESNGRSGKSITFESLYHLMKHDTIGGRDPKVFENKHVFENINEHTDFVLIDDVHQYFDSDFLFDKITGSMPINPKNTSGYKLPFEKSPKMAATSNHGLKRVDASTRDRILFMVYSDWYHVKTEDNDYTDTHKPINDFCIELFGDMYSREQWNADLNFFAQCVQFYLSCPSPIKIDPPMENVTKRNLLANIGQNFNDWASNYFREENKTLNAKVRKQTAFDSFIRETNARAITKNRFTKNLKEWCKLNAYTYNPAELADANGRIQENDGLNTHDCVYIMSTSFIKPELPF